MTEAEVYETYRLNSLPEHMRGAIYRYIQLGISPGGFGRAVLENDLVGAFNKADDTNMFFMRRWVDWLYNYAPPNCWGSPGNVVVWMAHQGLSNFKGGDAAP